MRKLLYILAFLAACAPLRAETPVVVELFTSQGCSSCPPADALLGHLAQQDDVLALSLHVDYWDYIGWADSFARPAFTARQKAYAHAAGDRMIYTPQMIVDGRHRIVGPKAMDLAEAVRHRAEAPSPVDVAAARRGEMLEVVAQPVGRVPGEMIVRLVRYRPKATVTIERGENAGRKLTYHNIVTDLQDLAAWDGKAPLELRHRLSGEDRAAILVQAAGHGPVLAAARAR